VASALRQADALLHIHDDQFPHDAKDEEGMVSSRMVDGVCRASNIEGWGANGEDAAVIAEEAGRTYTTIILRPPIPLPADGLCENG
jgi:hypothetical protein